MKTLSLYILILVLCLYFPGFSVSSAADLNEDNDSINIESDQEIIKLKKELEEQKKEDNSEIIASTLYFLNGEKSDIRTRETNLGNLITDSILANVEADLAFINSKGIKSSLNKGLISKGDVRNVLPAKDIVIIKEIKGSALLQVIEHSLSRYPAEEGLFPQLSGMTIIFSKEKIEQGRVLKVKINGQALEKERYYLMATNDFLADGGDGFEILKQAETVEEVGRLDKIFTDYLREQGIIKIKEEGRITAVSKEKKYFVYRVKEGECLYLLAKRFDTSVEKIKDLNNLEDENLIHTGQKLLIPGL